MKPREVHVGEVLQIDPNGARNPMFGACLLTVTESRSWGVQGYVQALGSGGAIGGQAHYRALWDELHETGGAAQFVVGDR